MGHAWMPPDHHKDDGQSECARNTGDVHTLYIRVGASCYSQKFQKVGVICSACYAIEFDDKWLMLNEENYETIRQKKPLARRKSGESRNEVYERLKEQSRSDYVKNI